MNSSTFSFTTSNTTTETTAETDNKMLQNSSPSESATSVTYNGQKITPIHYPPADAQLITYTIAVKTSDKLFAGTGAKVYAQLISDKYVGYVMSLENSVNHRNKFERNHSDVFVFPNMPEMGELRRLKIWHDDTGPLSSWHLDSVEVHDDHSNLVYCFPCNDWLSTKKDKGAQQSRLLDCKATHQKMAKLFHIDEGHTNIFKQTSNLNVQHQEKTTVNL